MTLQDDFKCTDGGRTAEGFKHERKDCTVRAIAAACDVPYSVAHAEMERRGRVNGKGFGFYQSVKNNPVFCGKRLVPVYDWNDHNHKCICLCTARKRFPKGRYIIRKAKHAFALIDGSRPPRVTTLSTNALAFASWLVWNQNSSACVLSPSKTRHIDFLLYTAMRSTLLK